MINQQSEGSSVRLFYEKLTAINSFTASMEKKNINKLIFFSNVLLGN